MQYRRVKVKGRFDHSKELHIFPRSRNNDERASTGLGMPNASGAQIVTPLQLTSGYVGFVSCSFI